MQRFDGSSREVSVGHDAQGARRCADMSGPTPGQRADDFLASMGGMMGGPPMGGPPMGGPPMGGPPMGGPPIGGPPIGGPPIGGPPIIPPIDAKKSSARCPGVGPLMSAQRRAPCASWPTLTSREEPSKRCTQRRPDVDVCNVEATRADVSTPVPTGLCRERGRVCAPTVV